MESIRIVALVVCTAGCLYWDVRARRIPNSWTYPALIIGITLFAVEGRWLDALLGITAGGGTLLALALLVPGALGMGDVKLAAAIGALTGGYPAMHAVVLAFLLSGVFVVGRSLLRGALLPMLKRSALLLLAILQGAGVGHRHRVDSLTGGSVPFGVFIVLAAWAGLLGVRLW